MDASLKPLETNPGFLLDLEGHKVVALRLPSRVVKKISGQEMETSGGILSKLKAKLRHAPETELWWTVTNVDNPLLEKSDRFKALVAHWLTTATGSTVNKADLAISASVPINGTIQAGSLLERKQMPQAPPSPSANNPE